MGTGDVEAVFLVTGLLGFIEFMEMAIKSLRVQYIKKKNENNRFWDRYRLQSFQKLRNRLRPIEFDKSIAIVLPMPKSIVVRFFLIAGPLGVLRLQRSGIRPTPSELFAICVSAES